MTDVNNVLVGMSIIGQSFSDIQAMTSVITGVHDEKIKLALHYKFFGALPVKTDDLDHQQIVSALEKLKNMHRHTIQGIFKQAEAEDKQATEAERAARMKALNTPHAMGTTAEIAAKFGLSKAEIRRRKADGTLDQLVHGNAIIGTLQ